MSTVWNGIAWAKRGTDIDGEPSADNNAVVTEVVLFVPPSPVQGQLVVASPVLALEALPPVESVPRGARHLFRTIERHDTNERADAAADHVAVGEHMRVELRGHNFGDKWLVSTTASIAKKLTDAGSNINLKADLVQIGRSDLVEDLGVIEIGFDTHKDPIRKELKAMGLKGAHFTHTEVKQLVRVFAVMAESEIAKCEVETAMTEARAYTAGLDNHIESHNQTINGYDAQIIKMEQDVALLNANLVAVQRKRTDELLKMHDAKVLKEVTDQTIEKLMRIAGPIQKVKLARLQATATGIIGKSKKGSMKTHRDLGLIASLELAEKNNWSASDITLPKVHQALLHTAQGNRDAMCINFTTAINAGAFSVAQVNQMMASAQAALTAMQQQAGPSGQ